MFNFFTVTKSKNFAIEALAGLASVEDFKSVNLKSSNLPLNQLWLPFKSLMLLHIKGRRHVQIRLVEPIYKSINRGDCFVLVTPDKLFNFVGAFSNVIEKSRSKDICAQIVRDKDLGCSATSTIVINDGKYCDQNARKFWSLLGKTDPSEELCESGHADEDELFELSLTETNMIYELSDETLVPIEDYWGQIPKISMLDTQKVLVFDFGSEIYVWNGKNASSIDKGIALKLAQEKYHLGYDYSMCDVCPLNYSQITGDRTILKVPKSSKTIPDWCLFAKITQHMETVLFRDKFQDWPDITVNIKDDVQLGENQFDIPPLNGGHLYKGEGYTEPNLVLENSNLGRGDFFYDTDTMRHFDILTESIKKWQVGEHEYKEIENKDDYGHFYSSESYTVRWIYRISITVRELTGKISEKNTVGRDRCAYFCWHGIDATPNEKGAAALMTVELDKEKGSQLRISQGDEPTAFIRLFKVLFIHQGKPNEEKFEKWRLYILSGNCSEETIFTEVPCNMRQLRSRTSMLLVNGQLKKVIVWHGAKSMTHTQKVTKNAAQLIVDKQFKQFFPQTTVTVRMEELYEGNETSQFFDAVQGTNRNLYNSLVDSHHLYDFTPRLFKFSSTSGTFEAVEVENALRMKDRPTPYPFSQSCLYKARQPTIFMVDNGHVIWLWFGWWPIEDTISPNESESESSSQSPSNENRSGVNRWQAERKSAMETSMSYWKAKKDAERKGNFNKKKCSSSSESSNASTLTDEEDLAHDVVDISLVKKSENEINGFIVWAGLEPTEFKSIFPDWIDRDDIAEINIQVRHRKTLLFS